MAEKTAAVVVSYNRCEKLLRCIAALQAQTCESLDILIIDNASTDGTAAKLQPLIEAGEIRYFNTGSNLGGAGGFNYGMRIAAESGAYSHIWLMDDDCYPEPTALDALFAAGEKVGEYGFLSSIAYFTDGSVCNMNIQKTSLKGKIEDYESETVPVIMATFVSCLFKTETVKKFGLPISDFFIWADDLEYTRRISRSLPCYAVNTSKVLHDMHSNAKVGIENDAPERLGRYSYLYRNEVYVYRREGFKGIVYLFLRASLHIAKALVRGKQPLKRAGIIFKSFLSGWCFRPEIEYVED